MDLLSYFVNVGYYTRVKNQHWIFSIICVIVPLSACYNDSTHVAREQILAKLASISSPQTGEHVVCFQQLIELDGSVGQVERSIPVLAAFSARFPEDPYKACTSILLAEVWDKLGQKTFARMYYLQALDSANDPIMLGESVHYRAIMRLLEGNPPALEKINYYNQLLSKFPQKVDQASIHYQNGFLNESIGEFIRSRQEFEAYLSDPAPKSRQDLSKIANIRERVNLYNLPRRWSRTSLAQLIQEIKNALRDRDIMRVKSLQSQNYFFAMSWLQEKINFNPNYVFEITRFINGSQGIYFENNIESYSNSQEAYLKSWGWNRDVPIWYLYFRKVDFPADPKFDGTWEWAGIYFGDTLQSSENPGGL